MSIYKPQSTTEKDQLAALKLAIDLYAHNYYSSIFTNGNILITNHQDAVNALSRLYNELLNNQEIDVRGACKILKKALEADGILIFSTTQQFLDYINKTVRDNGYFMSSNLDGCWDKFETWYSGCTDSKNSAEFEFIIGRRDNIEEKEEISLSVQIKNIEVEEDVFETEIYLFDKNTLENLK